MAYTFYEVYQKQISVLRLKELHHFSCLSLLSFSSSSLLSLPFLALPQVRSKEYNADIQVHTVRHAMLEQLRNPLQVRDSIAAELLLLAGQTRFIGFYQRPLPWCYHLPNNDTPTFNDRSAVGLPSV